MKAPETSSLWEQVAHSLQEFYSEAVGWTGEKARLGVKKMDILGLQRQIRRCMAELGGRVYDVHKRQQSVEGDARVRSLVAEIRRLEMELKAREEEIASLRRRRGAAERPEAPAQTPPGDDVGSA